MPKNEEIPAGQDRPDDQRWNVVFDEDFVRAATVREPVLRERKRVWPRNLVLGLLAVSAALLVLKFTGPSSSGGGTAVPAPETPSATPAATPTARAEPSADAVGGPGGMVPLAEAFPAEVQDGSGGTYTKVGATVLKSCTEPGTIGPALAAAIAASEGCVGEQIALYKDAQDNQFNLAVFTMKEPTDTFKLVSRLAMAIDEFQVAAQAPPPGSGLRTLPADSGMVQSFTGQERAMVVGMGQWSDGRVGDFQQLVDGRLMPLLEKVSENVGRYEGAN
ncbi:hypothetical protein OG264_35590 [Streptomyces xanthophaeus]|uniref:hypothetical protein n=1 Tax=Streptomyces xanthophaeus TaxID=67385 RepID=UPI00386DEA3A|nr:hypothetical protein OG264_35590 [Streptomyces xanthophaeus]WST58655.1 hypothetical protein OG605_02845 [Streptomyces xanthophaeus]